MTGAGVLEFGFQHQRTLWTLLSLPAVFVAQPKTSSSLSVHYWSVEGYYVSVIATLIKLIVSLILP